MGELKVAKELSHDIDTAKQVPSIKSNGLNVAKTPTEYEIKANKYLARFKDSPITGRMLSDANYNINKKYKKELPLEMALAQGQFESHFGTDKNASRDFINNPFNVGAEDDGNKQFFKSTQEGVNAYYDLMARKYLNNATMDDLLVNFVNDEGNRYASDKEYEKKLSGQIKFIRSYLNKKN